MFPLIVLLLIAECAQGSLLRKWKSGRVKHMTRTTTTTTEPSIPVSCTECKAPPSFECDLDLYDCDGATETFNIKARKGSCAQLTCPGSNLLADAVPVSSLTCNADGNWYYLDDARLIVLATSALCVSPCDQCAKPIVPDAEEFSQLPPKGSIYVAPTIDTTALPCYAQTCDGEGTLVVVRECEKVLTTALTCNGKGQWTSKGNVYTYSACKIPCDNCPAPVGYSDYPSTVSSHFPIQFNNYEFDCAQVEVNCPAGYALRITKSDGAGEIIAPENVARVTWTCRSGAWSIEYTNNAGEAQTATVTNHECYTGTCISCDTPILAAGITATVDFSMATGCKHYILSGCPGMYRAAGQSFGDGANRVRCANVAAGSSRAGWYGAGNNPVRWFETRDAIGCDDS